MQKFIDLESGRVVYLDDGIDPSMFIELNNHRSMTASEILKHETNPNTDYRVWDEDLLEWKDGRTPEQLAEHNRAKMPKLNQRRFRKLLRDNDIFDQAKDYVYSSGNGYIEDAWEFSEYFARLDPFILEAVGALGLTPEQVDAIWIS